MTPTSKTELRSPDEQRTAAGVAVTRWLWGGLVALMVATLAVEWLHIADLRQRVVQLELRCPSATTNKHLLTLSNHDQPSLANSQRSAATTVGPMMRL